jgi:hypothetical protein
MRWSERLAALVLVCDEIQPSVRSDTLSRQPSLILFSLGPMPRPLVFRLTVFEVIPLFVAAGIAAGYPRFVPGAFIVVALLIAVNTSLSIRDGATLARGGHIIERRKESFLFWLGISCTFLLWRHACFSQSMRSSRPNHAMERTTDSFGSSPTMKLRPQSEAARSLASRRSSCSR